jgi:hypothetical protein
VVPMGFRASPDLKILIKHCKIPPPCCKSWCGPLRETRGPTLTHQSRTMMRNMT